MKILEFFNVFLQFFHKEIFCEKLLFFFFQVQRIISKNKQNCDEIIFGRNSSVQRQRHSFDWSKTCGTNTHTHQMTALHCDTS